jgi:hypothetical protein
MRPRSPVKQNTRDSIRDKPQEQVSKLKHYTEHELSSPRPPKHNHSINVWRRRESRRAEELKDLWVLKACCSVKGSSAQDCRKCKQDQPRHDSWTIESNEK